MDAINIVDLEVFANHGVLPAENQLGQKFLVSATLFVDTRAAGASDDVADTVNYAEVCQLINRLMGERTYKLIERAAEVLAAAILDAYPQVERLQLEVKKPWAPIGLPVGCVSVRIDRAR